MAKEKFSEDDSKDQLYVPVKSKRKLKTKRIEFDGWASKPLIEFLKAIGKDTQNGISQYELTTVVNEYVNKNNLINPAKKKRVLCDDWLQYLFGKKVVPRIKIYDLLEPHLAENHDDSEHEDDSLSSEEIEENEMAASRKRKASSLGKKVSDNSKKLPGTPKSCFASIIRENIKLVYLNRSLVEELLKDPETFESKVVGSYVRIKSDPNDYSQKYSHQLLQVTGVRKAPGDVDAKIFLQISNMIKEIPISMLSNENFKEEECVDLQKRILAGSISRPTVMEFQQKVEILHEVITKQWLVKELSLLQNLINHANEKGWRRELHEYAEKKKLLSKPSEQERLLHEVPTVIAEELEPEDTVQDPEDEKKDDDCLPDLTVGGPSANTPFGTEAEQNLSNDNFCTTHVAEDMSDSPVQQQKRISDAMNSKDMSTEPQVIKTINQLAHTAVEDIMPEMISIRSEDNEKHVNTEGKGTHPQLVDLNNGGNLDENNPSPETVTKLAKPLVIELSSDDDDDHQITDSHNQPLIPDHPERKIWYYNDPHGVEQGPFSISLLRKWKEQGYFSPTFTIWKVDGSPVLLDDMISLYFPS